jgi:hypothetical protein
MQSSQFLSGKRNAPQKAKTNSHSIATPICFLGSIVKGLEVRGMYISTKSEEYMDMKPWKIISVVLRTNGLS